MRLIGDIIDMQTMIIRRETFNWVFLINLRINMEIFWPTEIVRENNSSIPESFSSRMKIGFCSGATIRVTFFVGGSNLKLSLE